MEKHGVLVVDKPAGLTSREVDNRIKRALGRNARIGHAGTLDPFATGVLPVMIGEATKLSQWLTGGTKVYEALLALGRKTATADCEGEVIAESPVPLVTEGAVLEAMRALTGELLQVPPKYSAIKHGGRPMYELARRGEAVEAAPRKITVDAWDLIRLGAGEIAFRVTCGSGTYVRTLGEQLAEQLGTVGHLKTLRRLQAGTLRIAQARPLDEALETWPLIPLTEATALPVITLSAEEETALRQGRKIQRSLTGHALAVGEGAEPVAIIESEPGTGICKVTRGFSFTGE